MVRPKISAWTYLVTGILLAGCVLCRTDGGAVTVPVKPEFGVTVDPDVPLGQALATVEKQIGAPVKIVNRFVAFSWQDGRETTILGQLRTQSAAGRTVMVTWEPGDGSDNNDPYPLGTVADGSQDVYMIGFLRQLAKFSAPVMLRFAHEMNGSWYAWAGNPRGYLAAWKHLSHLRDIWAPKVKLVWSVNNVDVPAANNFEQYWPGAAEVDILGLDGYNCLRGWQSPAEVFDAAYQRLTALAPKLAVWITETASCEGDQVPGSNAQSKANWISALLGIGAGIELNLPKLQAVVWFDRDKEFDWRIGSSSSSIMALRQSQAG